MVAAGGGTRSVFWSHLLAQPARPATPPYAGVTVQEATQAGSPRPRPVRAYRKPRGQVLAERLLVLPRSRQSRRARGRCRGNRVRRLSPAACPRTWPPAPASGSARAAWVFRYRDRGRGRPPQGSFSRRLRAGGSRKSSRSLNVVQAFLHPPRC